MSANPQLPTKSVKPSNPKVLLTSLILLEVLTLAVAGYFGYQFMQLKKDVSNSQIVPTLTVSPVLPTPNFIPNASTTPDLESVVTWKTGSIPMKAVTIDGGPPRSWLLSYDIPSLWTFETKSRINDRCGNFVFTSSDKLLTLNMDIVCGDWSANYTPWPDNGVIVGVQYNRGNDGHTAYMIRYFDSSKNQYVYTNAEAIADAPLDKSKTPIDNAVIIGYKNNTMIPFSKLVSLLLPTKGKIVKKVVILRKQIGLLTHSC